MVITANEIEKDGISIFEKFLDKCDEIVISLKGKKKYVVMDIDRYKELRSKELDAKYLDIMEDIKNGDFHTDIEKHLKEI